jgi:5-methylcytosine-specific restriction endonuclease McrA
MRNKYIENKLDKMFQELSRNKLCAICGKPAQAIHHIVSRTHKGLRWDKKNALPVCIECHRKIHDGLIDVYAYIPTERVLYLEMNKQYVYKMDEHFYKTREKELK